MTIGTDVLPDRHSLQVAPRFSVYNILETSFVSKVVPMQKCLEERLWGLQPRHRAIPHKHSTDAFNVQLQIHLCPV